jgi:hypothetical protein
VGICSDRFRASRPDQEIGCPEEEGHVSVLLPEFVTCQLRTQPARPRPFSPSCPLTTTISHNGLGPLRRWSARDGGALHLCVRVQLSLFSLVLSLLFRCSAHKFTFVVRVTLSSPSPGTTHPLLSHVYLPLLARHTLFFHHLPQMLSWSGTGLQVSPENGVL